VTKIMAMCAGILFCIACAALAAMLIVDTKHALAATNLGNYPDCAKHPDFGVIVRSSVDRKYYFIQSCTVADSASGEDFRHEVPNKPCDVPESNCPKIP
jgi:hypothetical protein